MPTSAFCRPERLASRGFTLLEMLVVLVILGLAASLVAPPLARTFDRVSEAGDRDSVRRELAALPMLARRGGVHVRIAAGQPIPSSLISVPTGWSVIALTELRVESSGFCEDASVQMRGPSQVLDLRLLAPDCRVESTDAL